MTLDDHHTAFWDCVLYDAPLFWIILGVIVHWSWCVTVCNQVCLDVDVNAAQRVLKTDIYTHESHDTHNAPIDVSSKDSVDLGKLKPCLCTHNELPLPPLSGSGTTPVARAQLSRDASVCVCVCALKTLTSIVTPSIRRERAVSSFRPDWHTVPVGIAGREPLVYPNCILGNCKCIGNTSIHADPTWRLFSLSAVGVNGPVMRLLAIRSLFSLSARWLQGLLFLGGFWGKFIFILFQSKELE